MKDKLITFETAKLAKEKGFNIPSHSYYFEDGVFKEFEINDTYGYYGDEYTVSRDEFYENWNDNWKTTKEGDRCFGCDKKPKYLETFSAPTQSLLQKWLREEHKIVVYPVPTGSWKYTLSYRYEDKEGKHQLGTIRRGGEPIFYDSYEEALEDGLITSLKLIK